MAFGSGDYIYEVAEGWGALPDGMEFQQVADVAVDAQDRVYVYNRGTHNLAIFNREGAYLQSWDLKHKEPHGICVDDDGNVYLADRNSHVVEKRNSDGELLLTLGTRDNPSDTGEQSQRFLVEKPGGPFNMPTGIAIGNFGDLFVSDGYSNCRVHHYNSSGSLMSSWGFPGKINPGDFHLPHGIGIDQYNRVVVADRENHRVQVFDENGEFQLMWTGFRQPTSVAFGPDGEIYVPELQGRVSIINEEGEFLSQWGGERSHAPGEFYAPHGMAIDSRGDIYVGEVLEGKRIQKFIRQR